MAFEYRAKCFDIEAGKSIVILNKVDAERLDLFAADRVIVVKDDKELISIVDISDKMVKAGEVGLFTDVWKKLGAKSGAKIVLKRAPKPLSVEFIKHKLDGGQIKKPEMETIIQDIMHENLTEAESSAFISSVYINGLSDDETIFLTDSIVGSGQKLDLGMHPVADKHSIGGVAGNRTTMILVPIVAATGVYIPKTSSRSITSPAGTADTMEVLAPVTHSVEEIKDIVAKTHGCMVWGGAVNLAAADDKLIQIRHPLRLDPKGMMLASVLAKKRAVGAEYVVIDVPVGRGAKMEDLTAAQSLAKDFLDIGSRLGMHIECAITDGSAPIGRYIGPALEARDVLETLQGRGSSDLLEKSCLLAGILLELCGRAPRGKGYNVAKQVIDSGAAYKKMMEIIEAQGGDPKVKPEDLPIGSKRHELIADRDGRVQHIDNRAISKIARAAGAPREKSAGIILHVQKGDKVIKGQTILEIVAEHQPSLDYAVETLEQNPPIELEKIVLQRMSGAKPITLEEIRFREMGGGSK